MSTKTEGTAESKAPATTKTKAPKAPKAPKAEKVKKVKAEKVSDGQEHRGRKVNSSSARQQRLARFAEKIARGEEVKRGRPRKDPSEKPVKVKKEKVAKTEKVKKAPVKKAESAPAVAKAKAKRKH